MKIYKIQRISDGLFSTGGITPDFSKKGKIWSALGHVTSHLTGCVEGAYYSKSYSYQGNMYQGNMDHATGTLLANCILIEYDVNKNDGSSTVINKTLLNEVAAAAKVRKEKREATGALQKKLRQIKYLEEQQKKAAKEREQLEQQLARLKAEVK